jgi:hypothetical protein
MSLDRKISQSSGSTKFVECGVWSAGKQTSDIIPQSLKKSSDSNRAMPTAHEDMLEREYFEVGVGSGVVATT